MKRELFRPITFKLQFKGNTTRNEIYRYVLNGIEETVKCMTFSPSQLAELSIKLGEFQMIVNRRLMPPNKSLYFDE